MEECGTDFAVDSGPIADATVLVGEYPFRGIASATWAETLVQLTRIGIRRGIVSPVEAVFREDSGAVERRLADVLADSPEWRLFKTVDPTKSFWRRELLDFLKDQPLAGVRLFNLYHGYSLSSKRAEEVFDLAAEHHLPVQVFCRMEDIRMQYAHVAQEATMPELLDATARGRKGNTLLLAGLSVQSVARLLQTAEACTNVFFDTSRLQGRWKTFETLPAKVFEDHFVFGSLWPINAPECPLTQLRYSNLDSTVRAAMFRGNFDRFLAGPNAIACTQKDLS